MRKPETTYFTWGFILGALSGAILALLLAPYRGAETRRRLQNQSIGLVGQSKGAVQDALTQFREKVIPNVSRLASRTGKTEEVASPEVAAQMAPKEKNATTTTDPT